MVCPVGRINLEDVMDYIDEEITANLSTAAEKQSAAEYRKALEQTNPRDIAESPFIYIRRQSLSLALTRIRLFDKITNVPGSIVECGVYKGNGLMLFYALSAICEPYNFTRKIIGFDTFEGFPSVGEKDGIYHKPGELFSGNYETILQWAKIHDANRPVGHLKKIELIKGDACITIPEYVKNNPQLVISLLYLDFDLYEPTKAALRHLLPLVPKGGVVVFDELGQKRDQGETVAMHELIGISNVKLRKFIHEPNGSYFIVA